MNITSTKCTIYFEDPFWVGVFEKNIDGKLSVCKVVFGSEPKDYMILEFVLANYSKLKFSPEILAEKAIKEKVNPKRLQRDSEKQIHKTGIGTKSQQALKLQQEENKITRKVKSKEQKETEKEQKYLLKQQKKLEKHKGR